MTGCTKIVSKEFTTKGSVNISLKQSESACDAAKVSYTKTNPYLMK